LYRRVMLAFCAGNWTDLEVSIHAGGDRLVKRCPNPMPGEEGEIEIRQVFEAEDFAAEFAPEHRDEAERIYERVSRQG
jgi:hypothetical protein